MSTRKEAEGWLNDIVDQYFKEQKKPFYKRLTPSVGNMYLYMYDPKYKATLPHWDMFPLVFPIDIYVGGFLGLNMHYLPPGARAALIRSLKNLTLSDDKYNTKTRLEGLTYMTLKEYGAYFSGYQNCVKRYLNGHVVNGSMFMVHPSQWEYTISLPLQKWVVNPNSRYGMPPPY